MCGLKNFININDKVEGIGKNYLQLQMPRCSRQKQNSKKHCICDLRKESWVFFLILSFFLLFSLSIVLARQADLKTSAKQRPVAQCFCSTPANRALFILFVNKQGCTHIQAQKSHNPQITIYFSPERSNLAKPQALVSSWALSLETLLARFSKYRCQIGKYWLTNVVGCFSACTATL